MTINLLIRWRKERKSLTLKQDLHQILLSCSLWKKNQSRVWRLSSDIQRYETWNIRRRWISWSWSNASKYSHHLFNIDRSKNHIHNYGEIKYQKLCHFFVSGFKISLEKYLMRIINEILDLLYFLQGWSKWYDKLAVLSEESDDEKRLINRIWRSKSWMNRIFSITRSWYSDSSRYHV